MKKEPHEKGSYLIRALAVLEQVAESDRLLTPTEINAGLQLPKATIHRLCAVLEDEQFLQRELDGKRMIPGIRLRQIALGVFRNEHFRTERATILQRLTDKIGETCNISVPDGSEMLYIDRAESDWPLRMQMPIGTRVPLYCTSSGKLYLSLLTQSKQENLINNLKLEAHTPNTLTRPSALKTELRRIQRENVGTDNEEFLEGMVCVAVPILDHQHRFFATLSFHAPSSRMSLKEALSHVPLLREASLDLGTLMAQREK